MIHQTLESILQCLTLKTPRNLEKAIKTESNAKAGFWGDKLPIHTSTIFATDISKFAYQIIKIYYPFKDLCLSKWYKNYYGIISDLGLENSLFGHHSLPTWFRMRAASELYKAKAPMYSFMERSHNMFMNSIVASTYQNLWYHLICLKPK